MVNFDPLDGSSNINANVNIGTIFSILPRITQKGSGTVEDCLQAGRRQLCAGYVMYGSSTMLVYTTGDGVHGFTFEPSVGEFLLSHPNIRTPTRGHIYSVNEGNYVQLGRRASSATWTGSRWRTRTTGRPYSARYVGSLVADFHRNLLYGGIFLYPGDRKNPQRQAARALRGGAARVHRRAGRRRGERRRAPHHGDRPRHAPRAHAAVHRQPGRRRRGEAFIQGKHVELTTDRRAASEVRTRL